jgi:hypothetical protein
MTALADELRRLIGALHDTLRYGFRSADRRDRGTCDGGAFPDGARAGGGL